MFSIFKKKDSGPKITDVVFATKEAKWNALVELAGQDNTLVFVAWFEESRDKLQQYFDIRNVQSQVITCREVCGTINNKQIFIEHYPLAEKEKNLFTSLQLPAVTIYSSLDEAFFAFFGGDKISSMLTKMGLDENEPVSHSMITNSIHNAQEKLAKKITIDQSAHSMKEWMQKNVNAGTS